MNKLKEYIPLLEWLPRYTRRDFRYDLVAGITVCVMLVPQGMAYAMLAGMPPIYGLYGGLVPLFLYAILGTSRQLSIGPVAVSALLVLAGIGQIAEPFSPRYIELVILTGFLIGILKVILSGLKMGFLVNFLSHPVMAGFTSAAAVIIGISQLKYLLGIDIPRQEVFYDTFFYAVQHLGEIHWLTFVICTGSIALIMLFRKINRKIPGALLVVIAGVLLTRFLHLDQMGVEAVGDVPKGLPDFSLPAWSLANIKAVMPTVITVTIIEIVECLGIAKVLEGKHRNYRVVPNQELLALGISKIGGAFFQALPTSASFTRSAVNNEMGARTGMASVITSILVGLTLAFLTPVFYYLPTAVLAAIVLLAVRSLFDLEEAVFLWKTHRRDFAMMAITFAATLALGIETGVLFGVVLSLLMVIYASSKPHVAVLGRLPETPYFRNISRFPNALQSDEILIVRFDASLYFGNATYFKDVIRELVEKRGTDLKLMILDASAINEIDSTGLRAFEDTLVFLKEKNIEFYVSSVKGPVRDVLAKAGMMEKIGEHNQFMTVNDAVEYYKHRQDKSADDCWSPAALQTNVPDAGSEEA